MFKMIRANRKGQCFGVGLAALVLGLTLFALGCANDPGKEKPPAEPEPTPAEEVATVGLDVCTNCHAGQVSAWLTGQHGNLEAIDHATHAPLNLGLDSDGFPYYDYFTNDTCAACHDPLGDGRRLSADWTGNAPRPVIGCESCHGGGAEHFGVGPIPFPKPDSNRCGQCHNAGFPDDHLRYHPNAANIVEDYATSPHLNSIAEPTLAIAAAAEDSKTVRATCGRCHTDEGFKLYVASVPGTSTAADFGRELDDQPAIEDATPVECFTCHDPHTANAGEPTRLKTSVLAGETQSGEFNTCTACHQLNNANGQVLQYAFHDPIANQSGSEEQIITNTHAAVPGDTRGNILSSTSHYPLYYVKKGDSDACAACHNPHSADVTINKQYARSGHGDALAKPWAEEKFGSSCQRCHTSTGFKNYANSLIAGTVYDSSKNDLTYLTSTQSTTIYCWGCHTDSKGGLRAFEGGYKITAVIEPTYMTMTGQPITFPDAGSSNVCITCHSGRKSGGSIWINSGAFNNLSFINSHYLPAGGILFGRIGYEFPGRDYANVPYFEHDLIGSAAAPDTGSNGPCVGCHLTSNPEKHLFLPVTREGDTITAITSTACATCHTGQYEMTVEKLVGEKEHFEAALEALQDQLALRSFFFNNCNPYFFKTAAFAAACDSSQAVKNWLTGAVAATGKPNMGAAFNYNVLDHEPGAFTHNRYYSKRLIYDSIDWLDDNNLNDSVKTTLDALDPAEHAYRNPASAYLLNESGGRP